jgi:hypothetical protein
MPLSHEFVAMMLGVRRFGVTVAPHVLEGIQVIRAKRGMITVLDREKLKELTDKAYSLSEAPVPGSTKARVRWPSIDGDGAQPKASLAGGDPDHPITQHHPPVPNKNRFEAGFRNHLPEARAQHRFLYRHKLVAVADCPLGLACDRQGVMSDPGEELDIA